MKNEQRKDLQKGRHPIPFSAYLAYLVVCTFLLTGVSFSKYVTHSNAEDSARVAKGSVTVAYDSDPDSVNLVVRNEDYSYDEFAFPSFAFDVSNENSEVAIGYDIVVTLDRPLQNGVTMVLSGDDGLPMNNFSISENGRVYTYSNAGTFKAGEKKTIPHMLGFIVGFYGFTEVGTYEYGIKISIESHQID